MLRKLYPVLVLYLVTSFSHAVDNDKIFVGVSTDEAAPSVTFSWDEQTTDVSVQISRRTIGSTGTSSWNLLGTVDHPQATYTDTTLQTGVYYEYKIYRPYLSGVVDAAASYIAVGVEAPLVEQRGKMILLVEEDMAAALPGELSQLELDLAADGWEVIRHDFGKDGVVHPDTVRAWIQSKYQEDPANTKGLYLFGRLPVMRGLASAPDGHNLYEHAMDAYFADVDDTWADNGDPTDNVLGTTYIPDAVELINGRVDLAGMSVWNKSETELLRDYLNKAHVFKRSGLDFTRRGTPAGSAWIRGEGQLVYSMFGSNDITPAYIQGNGLFDENDNLIDGNFHWVVDFGRAIGTEYANNEHKALFTINFGSHKQKWTQDNNPMRALLAQPTWGLTCAWGGRPYWFFHTGNMGYPAGDWAKRTQNNGTGEYAPEGSYTWMRGAGWNNLMGDPSLRMHPVASPTTLSASRSGGSVTLNWTASTDVAVLGYNIYRSTSRLGAYTKLNGSTLETETSFVDSTAPASGDLYYQVRAVKLEQVYTGSYYNQSLGTFCLLSDGQTSSNQAPTLSPWSTLSTQIETPVLITPSMSDPEGDDLALIVLAQPQNGTLSGESPNFVYQPDAGFTGTDSFTVAAFDGVNQSNPVTVEVAVSGTPLLTWSFADTPDSQALGSTDNSVGMNASTLVVGAGIDNTPTWMKHSDAVAFRKADSSTLTPDDYLEFTAEPVTGKSMDLDTLAFSVADNNLDEFYVQVEYSFNSFVTSQVLTLIESESLIGRGTSYNAGIWVFSDLSGISELQGLEQAVTFRMYFWSMDQAAIGKSGLGHADLVLAGTAESTVPTAVTIDDQTLSYGTLNTAYSQTPYAEGGTTPYTWAIASGSLPSGLSLNASTGEISGTPTEDGTFSFTMEVTDDASDTDTATISLSIISATSDIDNNGLADLWEVNNFGSIGQDGTADPDNDGADNEAEETYGSDPNEADEDGDLILDGAEIAYSRDTAAFDHASLPYSDNFEDRIGLLSENPYLWSIISGSSIEIKESIGALSTRGLELTGTDQEIIQFLDQTAIPVMWSDFEAVLTTFAPDAEPDLLAGTKVAFFLSESETAVNLHFRNGATWQSVELVTGFDTSAYHRYTVKQDYSAETFDLYVDDVLVASGAAFATDEVDPTPYAFRMKHKEGANPSLLDNVRFAATPPSGYGSPTTTYSTWSSAQSWPTGADTTATGDSEGDGNTNLLEYALDLDVSVDDYDQQPTGGYYDDGTDQWATLTYRRNKAQTDLTYTIQKSTDLSGWTDVTIDGIDAIETIIDSDVDGDGTAEEVEVKVKLASADDVLFLRLKVDDGTTPVTSMPVNGGGFSQPAWEDFEAYAAQSTVGGQGGWMLFAGIDPTVETAIDSRRGQVAEVSSDGTTDTELSALFKTTGDAVTWVEAAIVPTVYPAGSSPAVDADTAFAWFFDADGYLNVSDGGSWTALDTIASMDTNTWQRVTAKLDYGNDKIDVWLNGVQVATGLAFLDNLAQFSKIDVRQTSTTAAYLDDVIAQSEAIEALLPYSEGFENLTNGTSIDGYQDIWSVTDGTAVADTTQYQLGLQSLKIDGAASADLRGVGLGEAWVDLRVRPDGAASAPSLDTVTIAGLYFDDTGKVWAADGTAWTDTGVTVTLSNWQRVTARVDYSTQTWDLYINSNAAGTGYGFAATPETDSVRAVVVSGNNWLDELSIDTVNPL